MKSDIEIAESVELESIADIAGKLGISGDGFEQYGKYKAKLNIDKTEPRGKLILVTAINPTASGEGKTTVSIGLADGMQLIGCNVALALREPSLGPVFGVKGGATGGGYAQIAPMADINLHFTGDLHAITTANNLLSAMIDNHIKWGNALDISNIVFKRCMDCNDRALRQTVIGLGGEINGKPREDGFNITAASEIMAVLCLALNLEDLKKRLGEIVIGYDSKGRVVKACQLKAEEAMAIILKDAVKPNLVQTLEGVPAIVHGGPFANIAHGCNTLIATRAALSLADYVVTEAGFGADLGAEKFLDIKCRAGGLSPDAVVIVATIRALKLLGGADKKNLLSSDDAALSKGLENLGKHIDNITKVFNLNAVVTVNKFVTDTAQEVASIESFCAERGVECVPCSVWAEGGWGGKSLAETVKKAADKNKKKLTFSYPLTDSAEDKICAVAKKIYGAKNVIFLPKAQKELAALKAAGYGALPVCIAKTQYSLSDNPLLMGAPKDFELTVRDIQLRAGAGFIVAVAGDIMLMPGLPAAPNAENMTISPDGVIRGLF